MILASVPMEAGDQARRVKGGQGGTLQRLCHLVLHGKGNGAFNGSPKHIYSQKNTPALQRTTTNTFEYFMWCTVLTKMRT